jgi:D-alanyl-D-alanine carboxypeptidase
MLPPAIYFNFSFAACGPGINQQIQKAMNEARITQNIPGVEVSISCPGEAIPRDFVSGNTQLQGTSPIQSTNLFQIGSETKSFITAIILQLEAEGRLSLYDSIGKYLKNIPVEWQSITIQQLLNNTSGLFDYLRVQKFQTTLIASAYKKQWTTDELISYVLNIKPNFLPGLGWDYSSTNYVLVGQIIQIITHNLLENEIDNRFAKPLDLTNTYYVPRAYNSGLLQRMAHGYFMPEFVSKPIDVTDFNFSFTNAAGAMLSTAHDTAVWFRHLLTSESIIQERQRQELMTLVSLTNGQPLPPNNSNVGYGLGIMGLSTSPVGELWWHNGVTLGYVSTMTWLKCNDVVITVMQNNMPKIEPNPDGKRRLPLLIELINIIQQADTTRSCAKGTGAYTPKFIQQLGVVHIP